MQYSIAVCGKYLVSYNTLKEEKRKYLAETEKIKNYDSPQLHAKEFVGMNRKCVRI